MNKGVGANSRGSRVTVVIPTTGLRRLRYVACDISHSLFRLHSLPAFHRVALIRTHSLTVLPVLQSAKHAPRLASTSTLSRPLSNVPLRTKKVRPAFAGMLPKAHQLQRASSGLFCRR
jgi:hypothetical protein